MRHVLTIVSISLFLLGSLWLTTLGPAMAALLAVSLGALVGVSVLGEWSPWALTAGSLGALTYALVSPTFPVLGAALFFGAVFVPRAVRAKSSLGGSMVLASAVLGGAAASFVTGTYAQAGPTVLLTAIVVGAVLVSIALVPAVDERVAFSFRSLAWRTQGTTKLQFLRAAALRRRHPEVRGVLSKTANKRVKKAWRTLEKTARLRVESKRSGQAVLDKRIREYVGALTRATRAATQATELSAEMEDAVLSELKLEQEGLLAKASALQEVQESSV